MPTPTPIATPEATPTSTPTPLLTGEDLGIREVDVDRDTWRPRA